MKRRAFTLTEIIVVIGIILVLITLSAIVAGPAIARSKTAPACAANLKQLAVAYNLYNTDYDALPTRGALNFLLLQNAYHVNCQCPLTNRFYYDNYALAANLAGFKQASTKFPDGTDIPDFDLAKDVIIRCFDHGYDGYDRGSSVVILFTPKTRGFVLGARLDGSVQKVAPVSCWEFHTTLFSDPALVLALWPTCDRGNKKRKVNNDK